MLNRFGLAVTLPLLIASGLSAANDSDTQDLYFDKPVQIPEAILQPGKYKIHLEDQMADRAIVRLTEPGGRDHFLLTVPSRGLSASNKGLIFFRAQAESKILQGWECAGCKRLLEFVYPKDEAVKLTGSTGKPILAYDPSYDKLPDNLTAEDRKVVTLWLLSPKTIASEGKGEGLSAAKYGKPKMMVSAENLPQRMPKTATNAFTEIALGLASLCLAGALYLMRNLVARRVR